jgi:hypothetical protein
MLRGYVIERQTGEPQPAARYAPTADAPPSTWTTLFRMAGVSALAVVALIPIQGAIYILWPPPSTVEEYFTIFQSNALLGLLDLDLLLILDQLLMMLVLLALYVALKQTNQSLVLVGTAAGVVGAVLFIVSREATLSMYVLSQQHAATTSATDRAALVAAAQTLLTTYNGTVFSVGYFLGGLAMTVIAAVMLRGTTFSRGTGIAGVVAGVTGLVPASFGTLGFVLSFVSLLPLIVWLALTGRRLLQLGRGER